MPRHSTASEASLASATERATKSGRKDFEAIFSAHRGQLLRHCYRFTGALHDAEDLVQETMLNAWKAFGQFEGRASPLSWLYRIATNVGLTTLRRRASARRAFPDDLHRCTSRMPTRGPNTGDIPWIEPLPDLLVENMRDESPGPGAQYERRETVRLAFIAASQRLPPRQRAVLLLCDVLSWSAQETAEALRMSVPAVNSALQRARGTMSQGLSAEDVKPHASAEEQRTIAQNYADAWERTDVTALLSLLTKDAALVMPPFNEWYQGRPAIGTFLAWFFRGSWNDGVLPVFRFVPVSANGQPALGGYVRLRPGTRFQARSIHVLSLRRKKVDRITIFIGPRFISRFNLPPELDGA
jgi:RNA polymerase sigma-70 factor (ECF subfamily)